MFVLASGFGCHISRWTFTLVWKHVPCASAGSPTSPACPGASTCPPGTWPCWQMRGALQHTQLLSGEQWLPVCTPQETVFPLLSMIDCPSLYEGIKLSCTLYLCRWAVQHQAGIHDAGHEVTVLDIGSGVGLLPILAARWVTTGAHTPALDDLCLLHAH
jgi:hypothetical protein